MDDFSETAIIEELASQGYYSRPARLERLGLSEDDLVLAVITKGRVTKYENIMWFNENSQELYWHEHNQFYNSRPSNLEVERHRSDGSIIQTKDYLNYSYKLFCIEVDKLEKDFEAFRMDRVTPKKTESLISRIKKAANL